MQAANTIPRACFAPPLSDELLARYEELAAGVEDRETRDAIDQLLVCVKAWWNAPESKRRDGERWKLRHQGKTITVQEVPLTPELIDQLWDTTPWMRELESIEKLLDALPTGATEYSERLPVDEKDAEAGTFVAWNVQVLDQAAYDLRNAAFHLLWFCKEITLDREPVTADKL